VYPSTFFGLFPPFPRDERAFVAMSFDARFDPRWRDVIVPAVRAVLVNDKPMDPHRVDLRKVSDSILTEILDNIARCRVFLADITSIGEVGGRAVRNANVMYELGLAHAVRQAEEVLLFRSDDRELLFDIANVRVHRYDPDGSPESARQLVTETIVESLPEVDLKKGLAIRRAAESLDFHSWMALLEARGRPFHHPATRTMGQALGGLARAQAIGRLLEVGAIQAEFVRATPELLKDNEGPAERLINYRITSFGSTIADYGMNELGLFSPEIRELFEETLGDPARKPGDAHD
jgi:hypothetical protein